MTELRNIKWGQLAHDVFFEKVGRDALLKSHSLQWALTTALRKQGMAVLDNTDDIVIEYKDLRYKIDLINYPRIFEAYDRYWMDGLKKDDIVLDVGANIGSFSIPAASRCAKVFAIEPMFTTLLEGNAELNSALNLFVTGVAVGDGLVDCQEYVKRCRSSSWREIFGRGRLYTVVRLDCGGQEKNLDLSWLSNSGTLRQLEVEFHFWNRRDEEVWYNRWAPWLIDHDFGYKARWSKSRHWLYLTASKEFDYVKEVQLIDGSFRGKNLELWRI